MERIMWLALGGVAFVAALQAGHSSRARYVGRSRRTPALARARLHLRH